MKTMTGMASPVLGSNSSARPSWRGWAVAAGCGVIIGYLLGVGIDASYTHAVWPILSGLLACMVSILAARSHPVLVAFLASIIVVITSVVTVVIEQYRSGYWPITDEFTIEHYGTETMAAMRLTVFVLFLVCVPCLVASAVAAFVRRRVA